MARLADLFGHASSEWTNFLHLQSGLSSGLGLRCWQLASEAWCARWWPQFAHFSSGRYMDGGFYPLWVWEPLWHTEGTR